MQSLRVTAFPEVLFAESKRTIVVGSHVWLYCDVDSIAPTLTLRWYKNNAPLSQDVPHIRMRHSTSGTNTTFLLVIDKFQVSDNGLYWCIAGDGSGRVKGKELTLTGNKYKVLVCN